MSKPVIFVSHIHEDAQIAECLKKFIDELFLGMFEIFVSSDGASIRSGDNWSSSIENALQKAELVIAVISPEASNRKWIFFECGGAYFSNKRVIPVCCRNMQVSELGAPLSWLQATDGADRNSVKRFVSDIAVTFDLRSPTFNSGLLSKILQGAPCDLPANFEPVEPDIAERSFPIFFVVDTSASMHGQPIEILTQALKQLMDELLQVKSPKVIPLISIISFGSGAKELIPPSPLSSNIMEFQFQPGGSTDLGAALHIVAKRLKTTNWLSANYYKPMILLLTDGQPTDDWRAGLEELEQSTLGRKATRISVGLGSSPDFEFLKEISGNSVVSIPDIESIQGLSKFFFWLSNSIKTPVSSDQIELPSVNTWDEQ